MLPLVEENDIIDRIHPKRLLKVGSVVRVNDPDGHSRFDVVRNIRVEPSNRCINKIYWKYVDHETVVETYDGIVRGHRIRPLA